MDIFHAPGFRPNLSLPPPMPGQQPPGQVFQGQGIFATMPPGHGFPGQGAPVQTFPGQGVQGFLFPGQSFPRQGFPVQGPPPSGNLFGPRPPGLSNGMFYNDSLAHCSPPPLSYRPSPGFNSQMTPPPPPMANPNVLPPPMIKLYVAPPPSTNTRVPPPPMAITSVPPQRFSNMNMPPPQIPNTSVPPPSLGRMPGIIRHQSSMPVGVPGMLAQPEAGFRPFDSFERFGLPMAANHNGVFNGVATNHNGAFNGQRFRGGLHPQRGHNLQGHQYNGGRISFNGGNQEQKRKFEDDFRGKKKKCQKIDKRDLPENNAYFCEACDRGFKTEQIYTEHVAVHQKCSVEGCPFTAHAKIVKLHYDMQHRTGLAKKIWALDSPEDLEKWKEERRRNYPTAENLERKKKERKERFSRGDVLDNKCFGRMHGPGRGRGGRGRGRGGRFDNNRYRRESENDPRDQDQGDTSNQITGSTADKRRSEDKGEDSVKVASKAAAESDDANNNGREQKSSEKVENLADVHRGRKRKRKNNRQEKPVVQEKKARRRPALLEQLLASDIRHERNVVLQCVRYIVQNFDLNDKKSSTIFPPSAKALDVQESRGLIASAELGSPRYPEPSV